MSYESRLIEEIASEVEALAARSLPLKAQWIAHTICGRHEGGLADDESRDFWRHCGYEKTRAAVTKFINKWAGDKPETGGQMLLPGYEHVHAYYIVRRDGHDVALPVHDLTDGEIDAKAEQYQRMGSACFDHADELQRFKRERQTPPIAAQ